MMSARAGNGLVMRRAYQRFRHLASPICHERTILRGVLRTFLRLFAQISLLVAISASMALLIDSLGVTPAYCSGTGGCHAVKLAARRVLGGVPVPLIGLLALVGLLGVTTLRGGRAERLLELVGAIAAGLVGVALLLIQAFVLRTFCPFCVVVDSCAIVTALALLAARRVPSIGASADWLHRSSVLGLLCVACVAPVAWASLRPASAIPAALARYAVQDRITVVEFVDLSCSHCRSLYPILEQFRAQAGDRIHFVRLHAPMRTHHHARAAARVLECLQDDTPRIEKVTEFLFESPKLDREAVLGAAESVGLSEQEVEACWADAATERALDENLRTLEGLGFLGLPTTYVGGERIVGELPLPVYQAALERVRRSRGSTTSAGIAFAAIIALLVVGIVLLGRRAGKQVARRELPS